MPGWLKRFAGKFLCSKRGGVAVMVAVLLPVLLGMASLGTEATFLIYMRRQMQAAADSAALSAAEALAKGYTSEISVEADAVAASLGFTAGVSNVTVTVNHPPLSGTHIGNANAVEVIVAKPQSLPIASFFTSTAFKVSARAVALEMSGSGNFCVLALGTAAATGVSISNGASVSLNNCGLADNAPGAAALSVTGGASLNAQSVWVSGQTQVNNGGSITASGGLNVNQSAIADPYADVAMPASSGCNHNSLVLGWADDVQQLSPGTYCNGLSIGNGASVSLSAGIYYIESGSFTVGGGSTVTGSGVTIVLTKNTSNYATVNIANDAYVRLSSPTTGTMSGILFFGDRNAPITTTSTFAGGSGDDLTGAIYLPSQILSYSNGASPCGGCAQIIAWQIQFSGGVQLSSDCTDKGVKPISASASVQLVE